MPTNDTTTGNELVERGWLIEEPFGPHIHWIALEPNVRLRHLRVKRTTELGRRYEADEYESPVRRVKDANEALRFARKQDADAFIALVGRFLIEPKATEHEWLASLSHPASTNMQVAEAAYKRGWCDGYDDCESGVERHKDPMNEGAATYLSTITSAPNPSREQVDG